MKPLLTFITFLAIDLPWIGFLGKRWYDLWLAPFERTLRIAPAVGTYILLTLGVRMLIVPLAGNEPQKALLYGAVLGAVAYGVYDCTNYAVFTRYSLGMTIVDMVWGMSLCAVVSYLSARFFS